MIKKIKTHFKQRKIRKAQDRELIESLPSAFDHTKITWVAAEHIRHNRGKFWKIIMVGILLAAVISGFIHGQWSFSLVLTTFAITYYLMHREHPRDVEIKISEIGIKVGKRKYPYSRIKSFWIFYDPPYISTLNIRYHDHVLVDIAIQLEGQNPADVREFLLGKIPEKVGHLESFTDAIARLLKL